ncbi:MAG: hypothetical protein AAF960_11935 [Bacteroidota bacterium]
MRLLIVFTFLILTLLACQQKATPIDQNQTPNVFFDLKGFFEKEKAQLNTRSSFQKTVEINGAVEQKQLAQLNFDNELAVFVASDINRPAWSDKYRVDSIFGDSQELRQIQYESLDASLKTKKIVIDFDNNSVAEILIEKGIDNAVAQSKQTLLYQVAKGFYIQSEQALTLSETKNISVKVTY